MECRLEHANITVSSIDEGIRFLTAAFPGFKVRGEGRGDHGDYQKRWLYVGTDQTYLALEEITGTESPRRPTTTPVSTTSAWSSTIWTP